MSLREKSVSVCKVFISHLVIIIARHFEVTAVNEPYRSNACWHIPHNLARNRHSESRKVTATDLPCAIFLSRSPGLSRSIETVNTVITGSSTTLPVGVYT